MGNTNPPVVGKNRGHAQLIEILAALAVILIVVLLVASLFPTSYQATLQAARMSEAVNLARQALERQKQAASAQAIGNQTVDKEFQIQGRAVICQFFYRVDADSPPGVRPALWKVTVQWYHNSAVREVLLVGATPTQ